MPTLTPQLQDQLLLLLVDKVLFGLVLLIAAFVFGRALERYKAKESFWGEIRKRRLEVLLQILTKIQEAHDNFQILEHWIEESRKDIEDLKEWLKTKQERSDQIGRENTDLMKEIDEIFQKNRALLGSKLCHKLEPYLGQMTFTTVLLVAGTEPFHMEEALLHIRDTRRKRPSLEKLVRDFASIF